MLKIILSIGILLFSQSLFAQTFYRNEMGGVISKDEFEEQILNGPYFGVPGNGDEKVLIHRMPFGQVEAELFYHALDMQQTLKAGKSLVVIYYPGKDWCNSTISTTSSSLKKEHESIVKAVSRQGAADPVYIYKSNEGLDKYEGIVAWRADPDNIFEKTFFRFPYPCRSFVVIHPNGAFRSILGEYPNSQITQALKVLNKSAKK